MASTGDTSGNANWLLRSGSINVLYYITPKHKVTPQGSRQASAPARVILGKIMAAGAQREFGSGGIKHLPGGWQCHRQPQAPQAEPPSLHTVITASMQFLWQRKQTACRSLHPAGPTSRMLRSATSKGVCSYITGFEAVAPGLHPLSSFCRERAEWQGGGGCKIPSADCPRSHLTPCYNPFQTGEELRSSPSAANRSGLLLVLSTW